MEAREYMQQVGDIGVKIKNCMDRIEMIRAMASNIPSPEYGNTKVQVSKCGSNMELYVVKYVDMENKLREEIERLMEKQGEVLAVIERLPVVEYDMLYKFYFRSLSLKEIAYSFGRSYSWAAQMHHKALRDVQKIIDEDIEGCCAG